jgi:hypothetical protein
MFPRSTLSECGLGLLVTRLLVGLLPRPFLIILVSSCRRFLREVAPRLPRNLHCLYNPLPLHYRGRTCRLQALICAGSVLRARDPLLTKSLKKWCSTKLIPLHSSLTVLWRNKLITGKSWYALSPILSPPLMKIGASFLCSRYQNTRLIFTYLMTLFVSTLWGFDTFRSGAFNAPIWARPL